MANGCLDHFNELDVTDHSWDSLAGIIGHKDCQDILLDIGMPVRHRNVLYVCIFRVLISILAKNASFEGIHSSKGLLLYTPLKDSSFT